MSRLCSGVWRRVFAAPGTFPVHDQALSLLRDLPLLELNAAHTVPLDSLSLGETDCANASPAESEDEVPNQSMRGMRRESHT